MRKFPKLMQFYACRFHRENTRFKRILTVRILVPLPDKPLTMVGGFFILDGFKSILE